MIEAEGACLFRALLTHSHVVNAELIICNEDLSPVEHFRITATTTYILDTAQNGGRNFAFIVLLSFL